MTKKGLVVAKDEEGRRAAPQESAASSGGLGLNKTGLTTRIPSVKKLPSIEEKSALVVGKFSDSPTKLPPPNSPSSSEEDSPNVNKPSPPMGARFPPRGGILTRAESSGSLRRGTPRPGELKKSLSTVKFVLENSGLDQVEEEDYEMA